MTTNSVHLQQHYPTRPQHTADQQCAVCNYWGATHYVNRGSVGITTMVWLCDACLNREKQ